MYSKNTRLGLRLALATAWVCATAFAFHRAMLWESSPGSAALHAPVKQADVRLILVAHTYCPCTAAALRNLRSLSDAALSKLSPEIVLTGPDAKPGSTASNIVLATQIPHAKLTFCSENEGITRFGAKTSGQCYLYDAQGQLAFSGGLTAGRGAEGDCAGLEAIKNVLAGKACQKEAPVYGCALSTPERTNAQ